MYRWVAVDERTQRGEWRAQEMLGRPVVHAGRVEHVGSVADVIFDPATRRLAGLVLAGAGTDGSLLERVRGALGGPESQQIVEASHILALNGDIVMVDALPTQGEHATQLLHLPRVSDARGLAVVSLAGQRIGRFVDLLLDREGRGVTGYLVDTTRDGEADQPSRELHLPLPGVQHRSAPDSGRSPDRQFLVISASTSVRVGRDLIVVGEYAGGTADSGAGANISTQAVSPAAAEAPPWPAQPYATQRHAADASPFVAGEHLASPDAPTDVMRSSGEPR